MIFVHILIHALEFDLKKGNTMTAIIIPARAIEDANAVAGPQFTVALAPQGQKTATHFGCHWVNCPDHILNQLAILEGVLIADDWLALCMDHKLHSIDYFSETSTFTP